MKTRDAQHISVNSDYVWKAGKDGSERTIPLGALAMHDVGLYFPQLSPDACNTTSVSCRAPA